MHLSLIAPPLKNYLRPASARWFLRILTTLMREFPPPRRMYQWKRQFNK